MCPMQEQDTEPSSLVIRNWIYLSYGFSRILWSIPIGLLLFTGFISFRTPPAIRLPSYVVAVLLFYWGVADLNRVSLPAPHWKRHVRSCAILSFLLLYFSPFVYWAQNEPQSDHFMLNLLAFLATVAVTLWFINRLVHDLGQTLNDRALITQSLWSGRSVIALMLLPLVLLTAHLTWTAVQHDTHLYWVFMDARTLPLTRQLIALSLLPLGLTIGTTWQAGTRILQFLG